MNILVTNIGRRVYLMDFLNDLKKTYKKLNIHLADNDDYAASFSYRKVFIHKNTKFHGATYKAWRPY